MLKSIRAFVSVRSSVVGHFSEGPLREALLYTKPVETCRFGIIIILSQHMLKQELYTHELINS